MEVLISLAIASLLVMPLFLAVRNAASAQTRAGAASDVSRQARFALQRITAAVRRTPAATVLGAKAAGTTGGWLAPDMFCLNGAGAIIETVPADTACAGATAIASGVTAFSVQTFGATPGSVPVIQVQVTLAGAAGAGITLTARTRLGGGTL